jgi:hypothetical protein
MTNLIRGLRAKTNQQLSGENKNSLILKGFRKEIPVYDLCSREGFSFAMHWDAPRQQFLRSCVKHLLNQGRCP